MDVSYLIDYTTGNNIIEKKIRIACHRAKENLKDMTDKQLLEKCNPSFNGSDEIHAHHIYMSEAIKRGLIDGSKDKY